MPSTDTAIPEGQTAARSPEPVERLDYRASGLRKTVLSFAILILLPFAVSLPVMLFQRLAVGQWFDVAPLAIVSVAVAILLGLLLILLMAALRTRVTLGETSVSLMLPSSRGPTPRLAYRSATIPYADIKDVSLRREVFGGAFAPVVMQGAHISKKSGGGVTLGYVSEANVDPKFPYPRIARQIAARAGIAVTGEGGIWCLPQTPRQAAIFGVKPGQIAEISITDIERLNRRHRRVLLLLFNVLVTLTAAGIALDLVGR
jgi:hypothetical protein